MPDQLSFPKYIFGLHEPGGEWLMEEEGKHGWIVFTHELGHDPSVQQGHNYAPWADRGFGAIARLNHGYGATGTLPLPQFYDQFARRVRNFVANSQGCHIWVIGNEMNHGQERPEGQIITPDRYATCYKKCWDQIHTLPGRKEDQVVVGAVAPWNNTTAYPGNESGDWVKYLVDILQAIRQQGGTVDAISLHTYTHGRDPELVFSEQRMNAPFGKYRYHFRCYRDFMEAIPQDLRKVPVYITETDQDEPWEDANRGWVQNAYQEIDNWNKTPGNQQICTLVLYRWPVIDRWYIEGKRNVYRDFRAAMDHEYTWRKVQLPRQINGFTVSGAFLDFYDQLGEQLVGKPLSNEAVEDGRRTQYFERMILQQDQSGAIFLRDAGAEVLRVGRALRDAKNEIRALQQQVQELQREIYELHQGGLPGPSEPGDAGQEKPVVEVVQPRWENDIHRLPRHASKRYEHRDLGTIEHLVINHSAVPDTVSVDEIARFHTRNMGWPGIGYHFYIDGAGRIHQTNALTTVCYHVQKWDPVSIGICVAGNFTQVVPNEAQLASAGHLVAWLMQELGLPLTAVKGKKEFIDTQSPGHQWLTGKMWKNMLLDRVTRAQSGMQITHPPLPLPHYLLMWQTGDDWAQEDWAGARAYIGRFRVTHGFSIDDARTARCVTIVGNTSGVDVQAEQILLDTGCRVERIAGADPAEDGQILTEMAQLGQQFHSLKAK